jgi:hypothetical protein
MTTSDPDPFISVPKMEHGLPPDEVVRRLTRAVRGMGVAERRKAAALVAMEVNHLYRETGHVSVEQLAEEKFGIERRETRELLRAGRALLCLRAIDAALDEGRLTWRHVLILVRYATAQTEDAWLQRSQSLSYPDLLALAKRSREGEVPPA